MKKILIKDALIIKKEEQEKSDLLIEYGYIKKIATDIEADKETKVIKAEGNILSPGLIDSHTHGCYMYGTELMQDDLVENMAKGMIKHGVNYFVPTLQNNLEAIENMSKELERKKWLQKYVHGFYIEGPFINPEKKGGISEKFIRTVSLDFLKTVIERGKGYIRRMTIAPELENIDKVINILEQNDIHISFGHSAAEIGDIEKLSFNTKNAGLTHLFNAMTGINHKKAGLATFAFMNNDIFYELITDKVHVNEATIKICANLDADKLVLITDSMLCAGLPYGEYYYNGQKVNSGETAVRYADSGTICGANCLLNKSVLNYMQVTNTELYQAVRRATINPAKYIGLEKRGEIKEGNIADLILFDKQMNVVNNIYTSEINKDITAFS